LAITCDHYFKHKVISTLKSAANLVKFNRATFTFEEKQKAYKSKGKYISKNVLLLTDKEERKKARKVDELKVRSGLLVKATIDNLSDDSSDSDSDSDCDDDDIDNTNFAVVELARLNKDIAKLENGVISDDTNSTDDENISSNSSSNDDASDEETNDGNRSIRSITQRFNPSLPNSLITNSSFTSKKSFNMKEKNAIITTAINNNNHNNHTNKQKKMQRKTI
jgi:hypothetical protein